MAMEPRKWDNWYVIASVRPHFSRYDANGFVRHKEARLQGPVGGDGEDSLLAQAEITAHGASRIAWY